MENEDAAAGKKKTLPPFPFPFPPPPPLASRSSSATATANGCHPPGTSAIPAPRASELSIDAADASAESPRSKTESCAAVGGGGGGERGAAGEEEEEEDKE